MLPVLIDFPQLGFAIHSRGLMIVLAVLFAHLVGPRWIEALEGIDRRKTAQAMLWLLPAAFFGARFHYVINHWETYADQPLAFLILWGRGMHAGGALLLVIVTLPFALRHFAIPLGKFADGFVPALGVSIALARLGCFLRGCCVGVACQWPWCMRFPGSFLDRNEPLHPVQLYFAGAALLIAAGALCFHGRKRFDGQIALVALFLYSASSAALEFLRADHDGRIYWGTLPQLEWVALGMTAAALVALAWVGASIGVRKSMTQKAVVESTAES